MIRIRQRRVVKVLGVMGLGLALSLATACKKDDAAKAGAAGGDKAAEASGGISGGGVKPSSGDDLALLPVDSEVVIGLNFGQISQSGLWKQFVEPKLKTGETQRKLDEFKAKCPGFDPMSSFTSMSIGMKNAASGNPSVVVVAHGVDRAKALDCVDKNKDEMAKNGNEVTRDGDVLLVKGKRAEEQTAITFVNDNTAVAMVGDGATAAGVKAIAAGGSALKTSPAFVDMYKKVKTSDSLWGLASGKTLDKMPMKATAIYGSLNVTDGLAMDLRIRLDTPDAAKQMADMANSQAQQAKAFVDKSEFTAEGNEMHASVALSGQKLQALVAQLGPMMGMLMGGAMGGMGADKQ
jgi:hypothetical protein